MLGSGRYVEGSVMKHRVVDGECIASIAAQYGFGDGETILNHPQNAALKQTRPDGNQLHPGDELFIPPLDPEVHTLETGKRHRIVRPRPKRLLRVRFLDSDGEPLSGTYTLQSGAYSATGTLDGDGVLERKIPADIKQAEVTIGEMTETLLIGHLNPMDSTPDEGVSGAQARLYNLGFDPGEVDGELGPETQSAICAFQGAHGLDVTGELDDDTLGKLTDEYGC
jgi:hypothetical protein